MGSPLLIAVSGFNPSTSTSTVLTLLSARADATKVWTVPLPPALAGAGLGAINGLKGLFGVGKRPLIRYVREREREQCQQSLSGSFGASWRELREAIEQRLPPDFER